MANLDISKLDDVQKAQLVEGRWTSSSELWDVVAKTYQANTAIYSNQSPWLEAIPQRRKQYRVQANRIFVNMEAVINSLIANPPGLNLLPAREGIPAQEFARKMESFLGKKFLDLNTKETMRMGLRNLYFGRIIVIKPFWNPVINDFDYRTVDPRKVRFAKYARKEPDSEFAIEEIDDNLCAVIDRFPSKKVELMKKFGIAEGPNADNDLYVKNPDVKYKEAWVGDSVIFKLDNIILGTIKNPYWDWDGILVTEEEEASFKTLEGEGRRSAFEQIKLEQESRRATIAPATAEAPATPTPAEPAPIDGNQSPEVANQLPIENKAVDNGNPPAPTGQTAPETTQAPQYKPYFFNFFDNPRKPYIFATIFNNENSPVGRTDMITLSSELQRGIDKRKMDIDENCELANGVLKVDASVMGKSDAQRIRFETKGIIWGKGVKDGVTRETGQVLPQMVFDDMIDSRQEIDNIMAASSAFKGEREGQETKAGRLALIQQSYLRLNELVQVVDYVYREMFCWSMQLAKTRYTEPHYAKWMGKEGARQTIELIQHDIEEGSEVTVIAGKTLPKDDEFKFEQAQNDVEKGFISPVDYLEIAQYDNSKELAKNAVLYQQNPMSAVGLDQSQMPVPFTPGTPTPDQIASIAPKGIPSELGITPAAPATPTP